MNARARSGRLAGVRPFSRLYFKLAVVFLALLVAVGGFSLWHIARTSKLYFQEVQQHLERDVAAAIAKSTDFFEGDEVDHEALKGLFMKAMAVNPTLEVYLLDPQGRILGYDAPEEKIVRERVDLAPVRDFLGAEEGRIVLGDDPRSAGGRKVFSASKVEEDGRLAGYVYAILAGEEYDSVASALQRSYILRGSAWIAFLCLLLAALAGLAAFGLLTRPLRRLQRVVNSFQEDNLTARAPADSGDEIGALGKAFNRMADRILSQVQHIKENDRLRRELMANISHDLRTPISSLQGYLETVAQKAEELDPETRRSYLEAAIRNTRRLSRLVEDLFQLARFDSGEVSLEIESFSLAELVQDATQKFQLQAEQKGVKLGLRLPGGLPNVTGDIGLIERVIDNLLDNAIRYTPRGGQVSVALSALANAVQVRVTDTGCGIPAEDLPRVFDRFYRVEKSRSDDSGGTGLGLAIAKRILDLHKSVIDIRSRPDVGTAISFTLAA